jgi:hypothetical protein
MIDGASILISGLCVLLAFRFAKLGLPEDKHREDKTWTDFFATQLGIYHPSITPELRRKALAIAIAAGLFGFVVAHVVLTTIF